MKRKDRLEFLPEAVDLRYGRALETMRVHHDDFPIDTDCYRLPVNQIKVVSNVAGDEVRDLLRSGAKPCITAGSERVRVRWVDFLAAGRQGNALWLALAASDHRDVESALKVGTSAASWPSLAGDSERIKTVRQAVDALKTYATFPEAKLAIHKIPGPTMKRKDLIGALTERASAHYGGAECQCSRKSLRSESFDILIVCSTEDEKSIRGLFRSWQVKFIVVESMEAFFQKAIAALRISFGQGWFINADRFASAMKKAISQKVAPNPVVVGEYEDERGRPSEIAAAATGKLCSFGWLPDQWDNRDVMIGQATAGSPRADVLSRQFDEGLRIFPLPRVAPPEEATLQTDNVQSLVNDGWLSYKTWYPQDRVILAVECKHYGARKAKASCGQVEFQESKFFLFPPFHGSSLGLLRRLVPGCPFQVLGYTPGGSSATHSGVLERLVRLYRSDPYSKPVASSLLNQIVGICYPGSVPISRQSSLDQAYAIDCEIAELDNRRAGGKPTGRSDPTGGPRRPSSLELLLQSCTTGTGDRRKSLLLASKAVGSILRLRKQSIEILLNAPENPEDNGFDEVTSLNHEIREACKEDSDVLRSRGAKYSKLGLYKNTALILWHAARHRLGLTPSQHEWISDSFRLVFLVPLDHVEPRMVNPPVYGSTFPGKRRSPQFYPHLFSADQAEGAIPVDLKDLLSRTVKSLAMGGNGKKRGWLTNKISETNELMAGLMMRIGYVPDFPMESLPFDCKQDLQLILARLDSRLIVRCVLESDGGAKFLAAWSEKIAGSVREQAPVASADGDFRDNHERIEARFDVFRDCTGLAVAALDCCRSGIGEGKETTRRKKAEAFRVYFRVDKLFEYFRARMTYRSRGTVADDGDGKHVDLSLGLNVKAEDGLPLGLEHKLHGLLIDEKFKLEDAASDVRDWEDNEGKGHGETPEDLLEDILHDFYPKGNPPKAVLINRDRLLEHFK